MKKQLKILVLTSTFPKGPNDKVPSFVQDQIITMKKEYNFLNFFVLAPDNSSKERPDKNRYYIEFRYQYFIKYFQKLNENGLMSAVRGNYLNLIILPFYLILQLLFTLKLALKLKPDYIYAHFVTPQAITALLVSKLLKIEFVFSTHAHDAMILLKIPIIGKLILNLIVKNAKSFSSDTKVIEDQLKDSIKDKYWSENKSFISPMGINFNKFESADEEYLDQINNNQITISFIGRFAEKKGVEKLILSFAEIIKTNPDVQLLIIGVGSLQKKYERLIMKNGLMNKAKIINIFNDIPKLKYVYGNSQIIVIPSIIKKNGDMEGIPVVLLEALSFGNIVVASDDSNAGVVIKDGVNGFIYSNSKKDDLEKTILKVINISEKEKNSIAKKALETSNNYSWGKLSKLYFTKFFD